MHNLTKALLASAALGALASTPAIAEKTAHSPYNLTALHAGRAVNKTKRYRCGHFHGTSCTLAVYTSVPASDLRKRVALAGTFYKWSSSGDICSAPKEEMKSWKKSTYAKISNGVQTYSIGCSNGPTTFYGDFYKLTDTAGLGKTDYFESMLSAKFYNSGVKYKGQLILDVNVAIGTEKPARSSR